MISKEYQPVASAQHAEESRIYEEILERWDRDPRVMKFADSYRLAYGEWIVAPSGGWPPNRCPRTTFLSEIIGQWENYEKGKYGGDLWDAMRDAGFTGKTPTLKCYEGLQQATLLETALRTTRRNWSVLSDAYAQLVIEMKLAPDAGAFQVIVNRFMDSLK
jgi:hypothetical protein